MKRGESSYRSNFEGENPHKIPIKWYSCLKFENHPPKLVKRFFWVIFLRNGVLFIYLRCYLFKLGSEHCKQRKYNFIFSEEILPNSNGPFSPSKGCNGCTVTWVEELNKSCSWVVMHGIALDISFNLCDYLFNYSYLLISIQYINIVLVKIKVMC